MAWNSNRFSYNSWNYSNNNNENYRSNTNNVANVTNQTITDPWSLKIYRRNRDDANRPENFHLVDLSEGHYSFQINRISSNDESNRAIFLIQDATGVVRTHTVDSAITPDITPEQLGVSYESFNCGTHLFPYHTIDFETNTYKMYYVCISNFSGAPVGAPVGEPVIVEERVIPSGSSNNITYNDIANGDKMANFHGEFEHGRFYKKSTVNGLLRAVLPRNPYTRVGLRKSNVKLYKAKIGGRMKSRKMYRKRARVTKGRRTIRRRRVTRASRR